MIGLDSWIAGGERIAIHGDDLFRRIDGRGPWLTLLHGFPTSSWDWAPVVERLRDTHRTLAFDFLGFGDSDKPNRRYDLIAQADRVEAMWAAAGVEETAIAAHDYGVSVAKELLARTTKVRITAVVLSNGILYEALHRPLAIQRLLENPITGALVTRLVRERDFARNLGRVFSTAHPLDRTEAAQHWRAVSARGGTRIYHRLIRYLADGRIHAVRWRDALHATRVPLRFVWGMEDPVTGPPMLDELRRNLPGADVVELAGIGHYPQLEVPDRIAEAIATVTGAQPEPSR